MKNKSLIAVSIAVAGLLAVGAGTALARGWFSPAASPDEIVQRHEAMFQEQAGLLGLSIDDVKSAWAKGQSLEELANEKGVTDDELKERMTEQRKGRMSEMLKVLVDRGVITQTQADERRKVMEDQMGKGYGMMRGMGRHHGLGRGLDF